MCAKFCGGSSADVAIIERQPPQRRNAKVKEARRSVSTRAPAMAASSALPPRVLLQDCSNGARRFSVSPSLSSTSFQRREGIVQLNGITIRNARSPCFKVFAAEKGSKDVVMVDPVEAKRLAVKQMQQLQARAKFKRQRTIESINGGWAMLGITAGILIEGYTGKNILSQIAGYLHMLADVLDKYLPSSSP